MEDRLWELKEADEINASQNIGQNKQTQQTIGRSTNDYKVAAYNKMHFT